MRTIIATLALVPLLAAGAAFAQSHQGGPQGENPGANLPVASTRTPAAHGSGQGGAIGLNPAASTNPGAVSGSTGTPAYGSGQGGPLGQPNYQTIK